MTDDDDDARGDANLVAVSGEVIKSAVAGAIAAAPTGSAHMIAAGATFGALGGGAGEMLLRVVRSLRARPDAELHEAHAELAARAVEGVRDQLDEKVKALEEKIGADDAAAAVPPVTNAWSNAWARAEGRKQRILMAALVSSFDPESYEAGMALRCIDLLDRMDYPQVHQLMTDARRAEQALDEFRQSALRQVVQQGEPQHPPPSRELDRTDAPVDRRHETARTRAIRKELMGIGLMLRTEAVSSLHRAQWQVTWLGFELADFLRRGGYFDTPEDDAQPAASKPPG